MINLDLAYIAGFLDGDGSIMILTQKKSDMKSPYFVLTITIANTNEKVLFWLKKKIGGNLTTPKNRNIKSKIIGWKKIQMWRIREKRAENLVRQLLPYLIIKIKQAKLALKFQRYRCNLPKHGCKGRTIQELKFLKKYQDKMKSLNRRGIKK